MFALPSRRCFRSSCSARCRSAGAFAAICLIPVLATAQDNAPGKAAAHHPHHANHGKAVHHHPASHGHANPAAAPAKPTATPIPVPVPAPVPAPVPKPPPSAANKGSNTGLPLPRFAALRADEVNMRSGPGTRYPILWLYKRRDLPVKIEREFDVWRLVEDSDGVKGWVHQATLVGTRSFVVIPPGNPGPGSDTPAAASLAGNVGDRGPGTLLRDDPRDDAGVVAILRPGVVGRLRACPAQSGWCRVSTHNYSGWLQRSAIFGLLPNEAITPP